MRNNYIGNYPTPLLRGVVHIFLCFWLMQYYSPSYFISIDAYIANILMICGCIASITYHNVYYPKYEAIFQKKQLTNGYINLVCCHFMFI